jgi:hypothetical protein
MPVLIAKDIVREPLYCMVAVQNAWRWKSRYKHAARAIKHYMDSGAVVYLIEIAFNRREAVFADSGIDGLPANCGILGADSKFRHRYIGLRSLSELWLKESAINAGAARLADLHFDWQQICWLDADVVFVRPNWVGECIQLLQHYKFLQMFTQAQDLSPNYEMLPHGYPHSSGISFAHAWQQGIITAEPDKRLVVRQPAPPITPAIRQDVKQLAADLGKVVADVAQLTHDIDYPYIAPPGMPNIFPGLATACTRQAWDDVGGLFDIAIWGGGDYDMSHALIEQASARIHQGVHANYRLALTEWESRCRKHIRRNLGSMEGAIFHNWHGKKTQRKYVEKRQLMRKSAFDPFSHLKRDTQGLWQMHDDGSENFINFRDMMRRIAKERNEDSTDV